ncbi:MAG: hypothetical protein DRI65_09615 [Chloroflexota bacterium]|nr:MAG: hypothetical protein DRI65_09615 [Chloroflexota bacterium]
MKNLKITLPLTNSGEIIFLSPDETTSGVELVHQLTDAAFDVDPISLCIEVKTASGNVVCIHVPYDEDSDAAVTFNGKLI